MQFCVLLLATFVLLMATSGAECGYSKSKSKDVAVKEHDPAAGGSQNAQRQEGAQQNSQTESKTENVATTSHSANTTTNPAQSVKTVAEKNQFYLTLETKSAGWQNKK
uniref:Uncharacterized protein n=1 Tax=Globodera rostochiensis TaxID=31243 RepID=A0A914HNV8_GLORO